MPEVRFDIRWPDGHSERCYSPSLIVEELLPSARDYPVFEFIERARASLRIASERVRLKYGFECSAAIDQLKALETEAQKYPGEALVRVIAFHAGGYLPPLASDTGPSETEMGSSQTKSQTP